MFSVEVTDDFMNSVYGASRQSGSIFTVYAGESTLMLPGTTYQVTTGLRIRAIDQGTIGLLSPHQDALSPHLVVAPRVFDSQGKYKGDL